MTRSDTDKRSVRRAWARRRRGERGAAAVEFALCVPLLLLLVCGIIDFGLVFAGRYWVENGVDAAARTASVGTVGSTSSCTGGPSNTYTVALVCAVATDVGTPTGTSGQVSQVGVCFITPGAAASCSGTPATSGTVASQDVEVCASVTASSTTGLTSPYLSGKVETISSRLLIESGSASTSTTTAYGAFNASSTAVTYNGKSITGMACT